MGISDFLSKIFRKKRQVEGIQASQIAANDLKRTKSEKDFDKVSLESGQSSPVLEVQKDSLQLGIAAGYTGRSLKGIESSLNRIEAQMPTKDWFISYFGDQTPKLADLFKKHEENAQKRFEAIQENLISLQKLAGSVPTPIKTELLQKISTIEKQLPLTSRMKELLRIIKESREMSYGELASKLNISVSALRGLLANTIKRTNVIERFDKRRKGWVRYIGNDTNKIDLNRYDSLESESENNFGEQLLRDKFEKIAEKEGFKIIRRLFKTSPDFIIEKDGKTIGVELKMFANTSSLQRGMGQLLSAKKFYNLQETWLIFPPQTKPFYDEWLNIFRSSDIKLFILEDEKLVEVNLTVQ